MLKHLELELPSLPAWVHQLPQADSPAVPELACPLQMNIASEPGA